MKKLLAGSAALLALLTLVASGANAGTRGVATPKRILSVGTMYGVDGAFIGATHPIHQLPGDELPWAIHSVRGLLDSAGRLKLNISGLVFTNDPSVPPELQGINDETQFRAVLSCQTTNAAGDVVDTNIFTEGFPATMSGDCTIDAAIDLPKPCISPVIFIVAGSEDKWFAVTGFEAEGG